MHFGPFGVSPKRNERHRRHRHSQDANPLQWRRLPQLEASAREFAVGQIHIYSDQPRVTDI
jgi:hypothetical protein